MIVEKNMTVSFNYHIKDDNDNIIDSNEEYEPLQYLHGYNNILPGLENALQGLRLNDEKSVTLSPGQAYGNYDSALIFEIEKEHLGENVSGLEEGAVLENSAGNQFVIISIDDKKVTLDGNHPLAGKTLNIFLKVVALREATPEEIAQGRPLNPKESACGPGCCC